MRHACFRGHRRPDRIGGNAWRLAAVLLAGMAALAPAAAASWSTPPATGPGPRGIAIDDAGNVYTANFGSTGQPGAQAVTKITSSGVSLGECGSTNATGSGTGNPHSIAVGPTGDLFVTVFGKARVARISADCSVSTYDWGTTSTSPTELVIDPAGVVFVGNGGGDITKVVPGSPAVSSVWTTVANNPRGIGLDRAGNVYTASSDRNNTTRVRPDGTRSGTASLYTWALAGFSPWGVAVDDDGNIAVANTSDNSVTRIDKDGNVTCTALLGAGSTPYGIAIDAAGNVYTANFGSNNVSRVTPACAVTSLTGFGSGPFGIALDADGSIYTANNTSATVTKVAGASGVAPAPPAIPSAPTAVAGPTSATVTVTPRVSRRYGTPTSYVVRATQDPTRTCTITAPATSCEVTGLTGGSSYTFTAAAGLEAWETAASAASNAVTATGTAPASTAAPTVTGTPKVRETLTATSGVWTADPTPTYTYQWQRCNTNSGSCTDITAADSATYVLQPADTGKYMRVQVTASNGLLPNGVASSASPYSGPVVATASRTLYVNKYSPNRSSTPGCATPDFTAIGSADPTFSSGAVAAAVSGDTIHICGSPDAATDPYTPSATLSTKSLTFVGDGPTLTILDGESSRTQFYADRHDAGQATSYLDFEAMTITRGRDINSGGAVQAICRDVRVTNVHFTGNQGIGFGDGGGAIHTWDGGCSGLADVTVVNSVFSGNIAESLVAYGQWGSDGGAILAYGTVTVTGSVFEDNEARATTGSADPPRGGAIYARGGVSVTDSTFTSNSAIGATAATRPGGIGGAIHAGGGISITDSTFTSNTAVGPTAVTSVGANGGAIYVEGGPPNATITGSTFTGNAATGTGNYAGAVRRYGGNLTATNSTFTGNTADTAPVLSSSDDVTLTNVTVSANPGTNDLDAGYILRIGNSIVDETDVACRAPVPASTYKVNLGGNVIANTTAADCDPFVGGGGAPATKVTRASIALQTLADNGGPTETLALGPTSTARTAAGVNLLGTGPEDQRGMARPATGQSSGAYQLITRQLTVEKTGGGSGTVTSSPAGIACGPSCADQAEPFVQNPPFVTVTLTASAVPGSVFLGWSRPECTGTAPCAVPLDQARTVTARFVQIRRLTVATSGTGTGTVTSSPDGIDCGAVCAFDYADGDVVTLTATAAAGSTFAGWSGACTTTGPCAVTMDQAQGVTATFTAITPAPDPSPAAGATPTPERRPLARPAVAILSATVQARSQIRIRINVNRAGTIRITGTHAAIRAGRAGEAIACRTAVTVTRAVTTTVTCPLRAATSRLLATRSLVIDLRAEFSAGSGTTKATARASRSIRIDRIAPSPDAVTG